MRTPRLLTLSFLFTISVLSANAQTSLHAQFQQIADRSQGKVGVYALVLETGDTATLNAHRHEPMQSVYKFPIAMAMLHQVDKGLFKLDQKIHVTKADYIPAGHSPIRDSMPDGNMDITIRELLRYNVSESDGSACDVLLRLLGGTGNADKYVHRIGIKEISIALPEKIQVVNEKMQYQNWATPFGLTQLLKTFYTGNVLSKSSQALLLDLMIYSGPGAHRLKGLLPAGTVVAHKTGTSGTNNGFTPATNDIGIITLPNGNHLLISVLVSDSKADEATRELTIAQIAKAAWDHWAK